MKTRRCQPSGIMGSSCIVLHCWAQDQSTSTHATPRAAPSTGRPACDDYTISNLGCCRLDLPTDGGVLASPQPALQHDGSVDQLEEPIYDAMKGGVSQASLLPAGRRLLQLEVRHVRRMLSYHHLRAVLVGWAALLPKRQYSCGECRASGVLGISMRTQCGTAIGAGTFMRKV